jgi:hypothetical protein
MNATKQLLDRYNMTPKEKRTFFKEFGSDKAQAQVRALQTTYDATPKQKNTLFTLTGVSTLQSQIANINQSLDYASRDRRTQITVAYASVGRETIGGIQRDAEGTSATRPGWGWVGERGPELMYHRGGDSIIPNARSRRIASRAGGGSGGGLRIVEGRLSLDDNGHAFIRGIAAEEVDDAAAFDDTLGRMH